MSLTGTVRSSSAIGSLLIVSFAVAFPPPPLDIKQPSSGQVTPSHEQPQNETLANIAKRPLNTADFPIAIDHSPKEQRILHLAAEHALYNCQCVLLAVSRCRSNPITQGQGDHSGRASTAPVDPESLLNTTTFIRT
ncbi:hypothetical protein B0J14DRAFT_658662 [Halenospora varia]|nr:hypothetical protein B0J14DRAFT_658662 [Halenospora varia]